MCEFARGRLLDHKYPGMGRCQKQSEAGGAESRGLRPQVGPPLLGVSNHTPTFLRSAIYNPLPVSNSRVYTPHVEKVCMRFTACITLK